MSDNQGLIAVMPREVVEVAESGFFPVAAGDLRMMDIDIESSCGFWPRERESHNFYYVRVCVIINDGEIASADDDGRAPFLDRGFSIYDMTPMCEVIEGIYNCAESALEASGRKVSLRSISLIPLLVVIDGENHEVRCVFEARPSRCPRPVNNAQFRSRFRAWALGAGWTSAAVDYACDKLWLNEASITTDSHVEFLRSGYPQATVLVDGAVLNPSRSLKLQNHSPTGFEWGYGGSGPSQLALALLLEVGMSVECAVSLYQSYKREVISILDWEASLRGEDVIEWIRGKVMSEGVRVE